MYVDKTLAGLAAVQTLSRLIQPAVDRFIALDDEVQDEFRDVVTRFVRIYSFLSQIVSFTDAKLERPNSTTSSPAGGARRKRPIDPQHDNARSQTEPVKRPTAQRVPRAASPRNGDRSIGCWHGSDR